MARYIYKRNPWLDVARIVAVLAVVMLHCCSDFVTEYKTFTNEFVVGNIYSGLSRIGVPFFLMISGALFLDEQREVTLRGIFGKSIKGVAIITVIWAIIYSVIYNALLPVLNNKAIDIKSVVYGIINGHYHMWYLYMIIGLYAITPFLKRFVSGANKEMVLFFIVVSFVVQFCLPIVNEFCARYLHVNFLMSWVAGFHLDFFGGYIAYFLTGWYIVHVGISRKHVKYILFSLGLLSLIAMILYVHITGDHESVYTDISAPVFLYSVGAFLMLNETGRTVSEKTAQRLAEISKLTFGVYLIHVITITVFTKTFTYSGNPLLYVSVQFVVVAGVSFLAAYLISKIPAVKKIIKT